MEDKKKPKDFAGNVSFVHFIFMIKKENQICYFNINRLSITTHLIDQNLCHSKINRIEEKNEF